MSRTLFAAALLAGCMMAPYRSHKAKSGTGRSRSAETGWTALQRRRVGYKDEDDENHEYVIIARATSTDQIVVVLDL